MTHWFDAGRLFSRDGSQALFAAAFMLVEGERWTLAATVSAGLVVFCWFVFDDLLALPWPDSLLGHMAPELKDVIPGI